MQIKQLIYGDELWRDTVIRVSQSIPKAQAYKLPLNIFQENSRGCRDYTSLAHEIFKKLGVEKAYGC